MIPLGGQITPVGTARDPNTTMPMRGCSREFHDADSPPLPWRNFRITVVDGVVELIKSLRVVAILAPITRLRQEAVLAFCCSDDDPHLCFLSLTLLFRAAITVLLINRNCCRQLN